VHSWQAISGYLRYIVIKLDPKNANRGTDTGRRMVRQSIEDYGAGRSVLLDQDDTVIAGNKTVEAAQEMGIPIRVVETDGTELLAVKRTDIDLDTPRGRELAIADNRAAETGLDWDTDVLLGLQDKGTDLSLFWGDDEINTWKKDIPEAPGAEIDQAEVLREKWQTATGQTWQVGVHRLHCGDSTAWSDGGDVMIYDPPWDNIPKINVEGYDSTLAFTDGRRLCDIMQAFGPSPLWTFVWDCGGSWWSGDSRPLAKMKMAIWFGENIDLYNAEGSFREASTKPGVVSNSRGTYKYEPDPRGARLMDVYQESLVQLHKEGHQHAKPVTWIRLLIANCTQGDVFDPFLGSGTTMVACEQIGRMCYGIEIDPAYVAITLERMSKMDITPELIDGQT